MAERPGPAPTRAPIEELRRLIEAPFRRPWHVVVPFVLVVAMAVALGALLPKRYVSSTLILVAPDKLPESLVPNVATEHVVKRLQTMRQEILSRSLLERVIDELDPYGSKEREPLVDTIERMRDAIRVNVKGNDAFGIEYEHKDPHMAMKVADRLAALFMNDVVGARQRQVEEAYQFIDSELGVARKELEHKEEELRRYKEERMGTLPEQMVSNLATLQRLQLEQQGVSDNLRKAIDQQILVEGTPGAPGAAGPSAGLVSLRAQLAQLRLRYTDEHPDVRELLARVAELEASGGSTRPGDRDSAADATRIRVEQARMEVKLLRARQADLDRKIAEFGARVEKMPQTEQDIVSLTRDYQKLSDNYSGLLAKKLDVQLASKLEKRTKGEQFRIVDAAYLPGRPSFPDPLKFLLGGLALGIVVGMACAVGADLVDPSVRDVWALEATLPYPVLGVIPHIGVRQARKAVAAEPRGSLTSRAEP